MILITGANGQLGTDIIKECQKRNLDYLPTDVQDMDITRLESVEETFKKHKITAVLHLAAYTAVDAAEENSELCFKINTEGTKNLVTIAKQYDVPFLYVSTDYSFDGTKEGFYEVDDTCNPISVYGKSKYEGEQAVLNNLSKFFIVRISWVFSPQAKNFVKTMLKLGQEKTEINVVSDQFGSPTYTPDAAEVMLDMITSTKYGIYHLTNEGECSWAEFTSEIFKHAGYSTKVNYITTAEYPTKATRPMNSRMSKVSLDKAGFKRLPSWQDATKRCVAALKEKGEA